ncbi:MAG: DNA mismatch repair endonuclease MutL [Tepidisphaeraceae bacterium]
MPRTPIEKLSPSLVNRIAAGEVIERPASVVKELVENSLDAGATQITIEAEEGGNTLIRIIDNGAGIPPAELPLAFAPHATSKIRDDNDLTHIATLGFRGEALASIGSVSQSRILSRTREDSIAHEIQNLGGQIDQPQAASGNPGTVIEVRNLFFNTPARRKFLKGVSTEFGHIRDALVRIAIPFPEIAFKFLHNGRTVLDFPATTPRQRCLAAWPEEFADLCFSLDVRDAEINLTGLIGKPELASPTPKHQYLFLNRRCVRDRFIQHALREAYRGLTEPGRQPAAILLLSMPPQDLDVNVHPTKSEVRFRDSSRVHGLVLSAIRERLLTSDLTPAAVPHGPPQIPQHIELRQRLADFFRSPDARLEPPPAPLTAHAPPAQTPPPPAAIPGPVVSALQLHNSYLVAETEDGLIIIDQHALHERVMYEDLRSRLAVGPLESQRLLIPATFPAPPRQMAILDQVQPLLQRLGIEAAPVGPDGVAIHAFPSFLHRLDPIDFLQELLEKQFKRTGF